MGSGGVRVPPEEGQSWAYRMDWASPSCGCGGDAGHTVPTGSALVSCAPGVGGSPAAPRTAPAALQESSSLYCSRLRSALWAHSAKPVTSTSGGGCDPRPPQPDPTLCESEPQPGTPFPQSLAGPPSSGSSGSPVLSSAAFRGVEPRPQGRLSGCPPPRPPQP